MGKQHLEGEQLTRDQAVSFAESGAWEKLELKERAQFQLGQECLCMPLSAFHESVEALLGRPVWTHEFADSERLSAEAEGHAPKPTMDEIISLLPGTPIILVGGSR